MKGWGLFNGSGQSFKVIYSPMRVKDGRYGCCDSIMILCVEGYWCEDFGGQYFGSLGEQE